MYICSSVNIRTFKTEDKTKLTHGRFPLIYLFFWELSLNCSPLGVSLEDSNAPTVNKCPNAQHFPRQPHCTGCKLQGQIYRLGTAADSSSQQCVAHADCRDPEVHWLHKSLMSRIFFTSANFLEMNFTQVT